MQRKKIRTGERAKREKEGVAKALLDAADLISEINKLASFVYINMLKHLENQDVFGAKEAFKSIDNEEDRFVAKIAMQKIVVHMFGHRHVENNEVVPELRNYFSQVELESFRKEILSIAVDWEHRERGRISSNLKPRIRINNSLVENFEEAAE